MVHLFIIMTASHIELEGSEIQSNEERLTCCPSEFEVLFLEAHSPFDLDSHSVE